MTNDSTPKTIVNIDFISYEDFRNHVSNALDEYHKVYGKPMDFKSFNKNNIDAVKLVFDKIANNDKYSNVIRNEAQRQRDKASSNAIGYFHQNLFKYIHDPRGYCTCTVPKNGENGYDVVIDFKDGHEYVIRDDGNPPIFIRRLYVELKNKFNTMNSSNVMNELNMMKSTLSNESYAACAVVHAIARNDGSDAMWTAKSNGNHRIRLMGMKSLLELVTGESDAFEKVCMALPVVLSEVASTPEEIQDNILDGIKKTILDNGWSSSDKYAYEYALMDIGFSQYGFDILHTVSPSGSSIHWVSDNSEQLESKTVSD